MICLVSLFIGGIHLNENHLIDGQFILQLLSIILIMEIWNRVISAEIKLCSLVVIKLCYV